MIFLLLFAQGITFSLEIELEQVWTLTISTTIRIIRLKIGKDMPSLKTSMSSTITSTTKSAQKKKISITFSTIKQQIYQDICQIWNQMWLWAIRNDKSWKELQQNRLRLCKFQRKDSLRHRLLLCSDQVSMNQSLRMFHGWANYSMKISSFLSNILLISKMEKIQST